MTTTTLPVTLPRSASLFDTAKTFFALSSAIRVNTIVYAIKQIPLIKKLLPTALYASQGLKTFAQVLAVISEPIRIFGTKLLYYGLVAFAALTHGLVFHDRFDGVATPAALLCFLFADAVRRTFRFLFVHRSWCASPGHHHHAHGGKSHHDRAISV
jgi:hypothetical protein